MSDLFRPANRRLARAIVLAGAGAALGPAAAQGATVKVVGGVVTYAAAAGETNKITITSGQLSDRPDGLYIDELTKNQLVGSSGCTTVSTGAFCSGSDARKVVAHLGDKNDGATEKRSLNGGSSQIYGEAGDDAFAGPSVLATPASVRFDGGAGADTFSGVLGVGSAYGGDGNDTFALREPGNITVDAGAGNDTVTLGESFDYPGLLPKVLLGPGNDTLTLAESEFDGTRTTPYGTFGVLSAPMSQLSGGNGTDTVYLPATTSPLLFDLSGTATQLDIVASAPTTGRLYLIGSGAAESFFGSNGADVINPGGGVDYVNAGGAADRILAKDGVADTINCGSGTDILTADTNDTKIGCE